MDCSALHVKRPGRRGEAESATTAAVIHYDGDEDKPVCVVGKRSEENIKQGAV